MMNPNEKIRSNRKTATVVGLLFIAATVASILGSLLLLSPILTATEFLTEIAANETQVMLGVLLELTNSFAVVAIAIILFPIFSKFKVTLALGYVTLRIMESLILIVGSISLLTLTTVSEAYIQAVAPDAATFHALGNTLIAVHDWTDLLGAMIVFSLTALILNYVLYRTNLVPRFISLWGLVGAFLMLIAGLAGLFGLGYLSPVSILLGLPLALNEMFLAGWLIVKGFDTSAAASGSTGT